MVLGPDVRGRLKRFKRSLVEEPVTLAFPKWDQSFVVETDASLVGIAGILLKESETGRLHPIGFISSSLSQSQRNYFAGQLETWGLAAAVREWNIYLRTVPTVELRTDHNPLL